MPSSAYTNSDIDFDTDTDAGVAAIAEALNPPAIPDPEVIAPVRDARGILLPIFRLWMRDGYTLLTHAHTPGEAMGNATAILDVCGRIAKGRRVVRDGLLQTIS